MRIYEYESIIDSETGRTIPSLVRSKNYPEFSGKLSTPDSVADFMKAVYKMEQLAEEHVYVLAIRGIKVVGIYLLSRGSLNSSFIPYPELFYKVLHLGCKDFILCHNHPSGDVTPSRQDIEVTERTEEACKILGMHLKDHIIVGSEGYWSYLESKN